MEDNGLDVSTCLAAVRRGDEDAARALLNHLYPLVIRIVRAHRPVRESEADLAQTIFMKIFAKLDQFSGTVPLAHWVSRIAVNTCLNQLRTEKNRPELRWSDLDEEQEALLESLAASSDDLAPSHHVAARELVNKLLALLNPSDRLVITLLYLEGLAVEEVKQRTGWNSSLIKVRAFRARRKLRKHLDRLLREAQL
jgi:RNA polymerase sigma-70 factor (ECF subfamily)